jgi:ribosomal-protein-alanine N-acetyltransferase
VKAILETERLVLRTWTPDDDADALTIYRDPEVMYFLGGVTDQSPEDVGRRLTRLIGYHEQHGFGLWAVLEKVSGKVVGACGLKFLEDGAEVEVGYHLARAVWGRGYATEAAGACLRHGFDRLRLEQIVGVVALANHASRRVLEKIGMTFERIGWHYNRDVRVYVASRPREAAQ